MFGRKKTQPAPLRFSADPRPAYSASDGASEQGHDAAIAALSEAVGLDLDFGHAYVFAPSLWQVPGIGDMLRTAGIEPNMRGNRLALLKSPASVAKINALQPDHPLRATLEETGFGTLLYDPEAENGCSEGLAAMQVSTLKGFMEKYPADDARRYAVFDFHKWSHDVITGKVAI